MSYKVSWLVLGITLLFSSNRVFSSALYREDSLITTEHPVSIIEWNSVNELISVAYIDSEEISIIDSESGEIIRNLTRGWKNPLTYPVDIEWSPNGEYLASLNKNYIVQIWDVDTGDSIKEIKIDEKVERQFYDMASSSLAWHPTLKKIGVINDNYLTIWNLETDNLVDIHLGEGLYAGVDWSSDGKFFIVADDIGNITIYDTETLYPLKQFENIVNNYYPSEHKAQYFMLNPNDSTFVHFYGDTIFIRKTSNGEIILTLTLQSSDIQSLDWSPDGTKIASANGHHNTASIWDIKTGNIIQTIHTDSFVSSVSWGAEGSKLAVGSWDNLVLIRSASE